MDLEDDDYDDLNTDTAEPLYTEGEFEEALVEVRDAAFRKGLARGRDEARTEFLSHARFFSALNGDGDKFVKAFEALAAPVRKGFDESKHKRDHGQFARTEGASGPVKRVPTAEHVAKARATAAKLHARADGHREELTARLAELAAHMPEEAAGFAADHAAGKPVHDRLTTLLADKYKASGYAPNFYADPAHVALHAAASKASEHENTRADAREYEDRAGRAEAAIERERTRPEREARSAATQKRREARAAEKGERRAARKKNRAELGAALDKLGGIWGSVKGDAVHSESWTALKAELRYAAEHRGEFGADDARAIQQAALAVFKEHKGDDDWADVVEVAKKAGAVATGLLSKNLFKALDPTLALEVSRGGSEDGGSCPAIGERTGLEAAGRALGGGSGFGGDGATVRRHHVQRPGTSEAARRAEDPQGEAQSPQDENVLKSADPTDPQPDADDDDTDLHTPADDPARELLLHAVEYARECAHSGDDAQPVLDALHELGKDPHHLRRVLEGSVEKAVAWDSAKHPRSKDGRFISVDAIHRAKHDPKLAKELRKKVAPEDKQKLEDALASKSDIGHTAASKKREETRAKRAEKVADRDKARAIRDRLFAQHQQGLPLHADDLHALIPHLSTMDHAELSKVRTFLYGAGVSFGGKKRLDERRERVLAWAKGKAEEKPEAEEKPVEEVKDEPKAEGKLAGAPEPPAASAPEPPAASAPEPPAAEAPAKPKRTRKKKEPTPAPEAEPASEFETGLRAKLSGADTPLERAQTLASEHRYHARRGNAEKVATVANLMGEHGAAPLHEPGQTVPFDGRTMESESAVSDGQSVRVVHGGWSHPDAPGGTALRAAVELAPAPKPDRARNALSGREEAPTEEEFAAASGAGKSPESSPTTVDKPAGGDNNPPVPPTSGGPTGEGGKVTSPGSTAKIGRTTWTVGRETTPAGYADQYGIRMYDVRNGTKVKTAHYNVATGEWSWPGTGSLSEGPKRSRVNWRK